jgi:FkbM family methyltransferase
MQYMIPPGVLYNSWNYANLWIINGKLSAVKCITKNCGIGWSSTTASGLESSSTHALVPAGHYIAMFLLVWTIYLFELVCPVTSNDDALLRALKSLQQKNILAHDVKHIMDIGAFVGDWTQFIKNSSLFPNAEFLLFEANSVHTPKLEATGEQFVTTLLGDEDGKEVLYYTSLGEDWQTHSGNSIYLENTIAFQSNFTSETRLTATIDAILMLRGAADVSWDLMKLDVQGSEVDVLRGARETILKHRPVLITESSLVPYNAGAPAFFDVHVFMESIGYKLADVVEVHHAYFTHRGCCSESTPVDMLFQSDLLQIDVLWVPREKVSYWFLDKERNQDPPKWDCVKL